MATPPPDMKTVIPDLKNISLDQLTELSPPLFAHSIALYRERFKKNGVPLPETAFAAPASGVGNSNVIHLLREAQQSKHTMLAHAIAGATGDANQADPGAAAFRAGYELLVTDDAYLDRYTLPMSADLDAGQLEQWRQRVGSAFGVLVRQHRWAAGPVAAGVGVIVPLTPHSETDLITATSPAAFGAIATSWPPDPVTLAETLIHEFQHVKLCGLLDLVPLATSGGDKVYAPWRRDPRPAGGLLQGIYAHVGIVRFWAAQRHAETEPDDILRAQAQFARWRPMITAAVDTLRQTGSLTAEGERFAELVRAAGERFADEPVPDDAVQVAREASLDHWLTWQIQHMAVDAPGAARLADAYRAGEPDPGPALPGTWIQEDVRKLGSSVRSRLLNMRYLEPARYRELLDGQTLSLTEADRLMLSRATEAAVRGYRDLISESADPQPEAWVGLALALNQFPASPLADAFADRLPVLFEVHSCLGAECDPLDLAGWFA
jgi:hypothetical protein